MTFLKCILASYAVPCVWGRYKVFRNATIPLRLDDIDCDSATFIGDVKRRDLSNRSCRLICAQDCKLYHTKKEIAQCLADREALTCAFEWYEGYSILGKGCDDSIPGYYPLQLVEDPRFGLHASMSERGMAWVEVMYATNIEKAGNSDCVTGSPGYMSAWPQSYLSWDGNTSKCIDKNGNPTHYEAGYTLKNVGMPTPLVRHDYSYTLGFNITDWMTRGGNLLEGGMVIVLQANQCEGTYKHRPGIGGVVVQSRHPLTNFADFL